MAIRLGIVNKGYGMSPQAMDPLNTCLILSAVSGWSISHFLSHFTPPRPNPLRERSPMAPWLQLV